MRRRLLQYVWGRRQRVLDLQFLRQWHFSCVDLRTLDLVLGVRQNISSTLPDGECIFYKGG